jgi:hypothetical protein
MPHQPYWYREIPAILRWLEAISDPLLDRRGIQTIFRVSQTEAQRILKRVGAMHLGSTYVVTRWQLLEWVRRVARNDATAQELQRVERVETNLEEHRSELAARKVVIQADPAIQEIEDLPAGVHLRPGELRIEFFGTEDLLRHLYELSQVIAKDFLRFRQRIEE